MGDNYKKCSICKLPKVGNYSGIDKAGHAIYLSTNGSRWYGRSCPECYLIKIKESRKIRLGKKELITTNCLFCNNIFKQKASTQKTCSKECKYKLRWTNKKAVRKTKFCIKCNKKLLDNKKKYCSSECKSKKISRVKNKLITNHCSICNKETKNKFYCSKTCLSLKPKLKNIKSVQIYDKICIRCNNIFITKKKFGQKYCSKECQINNYRKTKKAFDKIRELKKKSRVPKWANKKEIKSIYNNCPKGFHVDHIIPLNNPNVSGLHVEYNLQYLTEKENMLKSNYFDGTYSNITWKKIKHEL